ncbi:MAG TPA: exodeoxyribonuclease VII large subunit [candidate division Zixibacteria bacterium]|nr:exodeoxyribonuclease VII large subunit [candidate division Zixibacteria bacterium]
MPTTSYEPGLPLTERGGRHIVTVSELAQAVKRTLDGQLGALWVVGEISNFRIPPSGHFYFTLKDDRSQIAAVMFRRPGNGPGFEPENGMEVLCFGRVSLYTVRGDLQFYVDVIEPRGYGALYAAFEQLKKRLAAEGLFAPERKRPLPFLPVSIGIVTSEKGAALRDMLRVIDDRFPDRRIVVRPVRVQGDGAAAEIAAAIRELGAHGGVDVMIVGRGGGSVEDLWAFNEEIVARAIAASPVPVVSAVGHEIDFTIADFVADLRAPTPTAAAQMVIPRRADLAERLGALEIQLLRCMRAEVAAARERCDALARRLSDPGRKLRENQQRLDEAALDLVRSFRERLRRSRERLAHAAGRLDALSPLAVLQRGYAIAHRLPEERIIKDSASLSRGDLLRVRLARGEALCRVEESK